MVMCVLLDPTEPADHPPPVHDMLPRPPTHPPVGAVPYEDLPPQHRPLRAHLPRHPERQMEPCPADSHSAAEVCTACWSGLGVEKGGLQVVCVCTCQFACAFVLPFSLCVETDELQFVDVD